MNGGAKKSPYKRISLSRGQNSRRTSERFGVCVDCCKKRENEGRLAWTQPEQGHCGGKKSAMWGRFLHVRRTEKHWTLVAAREKGSWKSPGFTSTGWAEVAGNTRRKKGNASMMTNRQFGHYGVCDRRREEYRPRAHLPRRKLPREFSETLWKNQGKNWLTIGKQSNRSKKTSSVWIFSWVLQTLGVIKRKWQNADFL